MRWGRARRDDEQPPAAAAADAGHSEDLDGLLDDVRDLRLFLAADLSAAAGAAEDGAAEVVGDIVDAERRRLEAFTRAADRRLLRLAAAAARPVPLGAGTPSRRRRVRRRVVQALPALPLVGAMAFSAAAATGALTLPSPDHHRHEAPAVADESTAGASANGAGQDVTTAPVDESFQTFVGVVDGQPSADEVISAGMSLHEQISRVLAGPSGPAQVAALARLVALEQQLLQLKQPPGAAVVLAAAGQLRARLDGVLPQVQASIASSAPSFPSAPSPTSPSPSRRATPAPATSPSAAPSPTGSPSTARPDSSPAGAPDGRIDGALH